GFIGLYLAARPHTFDMVTLIRTHPLTGHGLYGGLVLLAVAAGLAVKTPTVPFHTWLPPAHTEAPAAGSAVLAGAMLQMGTYGFVRHALPMLPVPRRPHAGAFAICGGGSAMDRALVCLGQTSFQRTFPSPPVSPMASIRLAAGAAGPRAGTTAQARQLAVAGAVTQMVSHGLLTGALF